MSPYPLFLLFLPSFLNCQPSTWSCPQFSCFLYLHTEHLEQGEGGTKVFMQASCKRHRELQHLRKTSLAYFSLADSQHGHRYLITCLRNLLSALCPCPADQPEGRLILTTTTWVRPYLPLLLFASQQWVQEGQSEQLSSSPSPCAQQMTCKPLTIRERITSYFILVILRLK